MVGARVDTCEVRLWGHTIGAAYWDDEQILEIIALVGFYHTVSFFTNALALPPEPYGRRFPATRQ